jgi:hypothetical protein
VNTVGNGDSEIITFINDNANKKVYLSSVTLLQILEKMGLGGSYNGGDILTEYGYNWLKETLESHKAATWIGFAAYFKRSDLT